MLTKLPLPVDVHFHARDFNQTDKGTFESETRSALSSGFGTVFCMPNTDPPIISLEQLNQARKLALGNVYCDVGFNFGTRGENLEELERAYSLVKALKVYLNPTTGDLEIKDPQKVDEVFAAWPGKKPIMVHAEDGDKLSLVIRLAQKYERRLHICHVSLMEQVWYIRRAKSWGLQISAEVCPHHLVFTQGDLAKLGSYGIMKPPLATQADQTELWRALADGTIDMIATDHAPHTRTEKASDKPPFGVIGEPAFSVLWQEFCQRGWSVSRLIELISTNPRNIFDISVDENSFMWIDLNEEFTFEEDMVQSKAGYSPYVGRQARGRIQEVVLHGVEVVHEGKILDVKKGRLI